MSMTNCTTLTLHPSQTVLQVVVHGSQFAWGVPSAVGLLLVGFDVERAHLHRLGSHSFVPPSGSFRHIQGVIVSDSHRL